MNDDIYTTIKNKAKMKRRLPRKLKKKLYNQLMGLYPDRKRKEFKITRYSPKAKERSRNKGGLVNAIFPELALGITCWELG